MANWSTKDPFCGRTRVIEKDVNSLLLLRVEAKLIVVNLTRLPRAQDFMKSIVIDELKNTINYWSSIQCDYYSEACIVQLEELDHESGVSLKVLGDEEVSFNLVWTSKPITNGWKATAKLTENAATAIAFFLISELTEYTIIEESLIGTGIDYWLGYDESHALYDEDNFMRARLEVSGIRSGHVHLEGRVRAKLNQTSSSDYTRLPAYVVVAEFGSPIAVLVKK